MASVDDWAAKAAEHISLEFLLRLGDRNREAAESRIAAIIATFAEPLVALLQEARREHYHHQDETGLILSTYCCPQCTCVSWNYVAKSQDEGELDAENEPNSDEACTCGADAWNVRVDAALEGK